MSVRQYIGARYVPKFYGFNNGVWESNKEYEPLTIVQYNGNSYTSKKTVPANIGNPGENPDYWVVTGNYNAQVEDYRIECNQTKTNSLNRYRSTNKKILLFGDSYGMADGEGGWCSRVSNILTPNGHSVNYVANSGYGFIGYSGAGTFLEEITEYATTMTSQQKEEITDLVIAGGYNDYYYQESAILNAMDSCLTYCKSTFPNAKIWVGFMGFDISYDIAHILLDTIEPIYRKGTLKNNCFYMVNLPYITHDTNAMMDTRHPNSVGNQRIAEMVSEYIINGECNADLIRVPMNISLIEGLTNSNMGNSYQYAHNGIVESYIQSYRFQATSGVLNLKFNQNTPTKIATLKGCIVGDPIYTAGTNMHCVCKLTGIDGFVHATIRFAIYNNELYMIPDFSNQANPDTTYECTEMFVPLIKIITNMRIS